MSEISFRYQINRLEWFVLGLASIVLFLIYQYEIDFWLADLIFQKTHWDLRDSFLLKNVFHQYIKIPPIAAYLILAYILAVKILEATDIYGIVRLSVLLLTVATNVIIILVLQHFIEADCPCNLIQYGGDKPFFNLFNYSPEFLPSAHCFPSAHASVGFSWIALFFHFKSGGSHTAHKSLLATIIFGSFLGVVQQFRGAHFLSHDIWTMLICFINSMIVYSIADRLLRKREAL